MRGADSDSMLGVWLGGEWSDYWTVEEEDDGLVFIDRDGMRFGGVLDWLRDGTDHVLFNIQGTSPADCAFGRLIRNTEQPEREHCVHWLSSLLCESHYFGLSTLQTWCSQTLDNMDTPQLFDCTHKRDLDQYLHKQQEYLATLPSDNVSPNLITPANSVRLISRSCRLCRLTGTFSAHIKPAHDKANQRPRYLLGFRCSCSVRLEVPTAALSYQTFGFEFLGRCQQSEFCATDDAKAVHLGDHPVSGLRSVWWTDEMGNRMYSKPVETENKVGHYLIPYLVQQGRCPLAIQHTHNCSV
eukprot:TRINITY_DN66607_c2_g3_i1.p1 TRINITY_DN66607_c2_g3~~TRINITY_DN66607_c2_g3_i1.p1  ORF type:complete len:309 (+),score=3.40 TRINITY_DN66607_c2_g3_i1:34-927(+)